EVIDARCVGDQFAGEFRFGLFDGDGCTRKRGATRISDGSNDGSVENLCVEGWRGKRAGEEESGAAKCTDVTTNGQRHSTLLESGFTVDRSEGPFLPVGAYARTLVGCCQAGHHRWGR